MPRFLVLERQEGPSWVHKQPGLHHDLETSKQNQFYRNKQVTFFFISFENLLILCWQCEPGHIEKLHQENRHIPQARTTWHLREKLVVGLLLRETGLLAGRCTLGAGSCFHSRISEDDISVCRVSWFKWLFYTHFQPNPIFKFQATWRPELFLECAPLILIKIKLNKEPGRCLRRSLGGDAMFPYSSTWRKLPALLGSQSLHVQIKRVTISFQSLQRLFEIVMDTYTYICVSYNHV